MTSCPPMPSATNDTTRIRRLPPEYFVDTKKMPRIDLAALLVATGAHAPFVGFIPRDLMEAARKATRRGFPRYQPPTFARLFAELRFRWPELFVWLRVLALIDALQRRPLNPIMSSCGGPSAVPPRRALHDEPPPRQALLARARASGVACSACEGALLSAGL